MVQLAAENSCVGVTVGYAVSAVQDGVDLPMVLTHDEESYNR